MSTVTPNEEVRASAPAETLEERDERLDRDPLVTTVRTLLRLHEGELRAADLIRQLASPPRLTAEELLEPVPPGRPDLSDADSALRPYGRLMSQERSLEEIAAALPAIDVALARAQHWVGALAAQRATHHAREDDARGALHAAEDALATEQSRNVLARALRGKVRAALERNATLHRRTAEDAAIATSRITSDAVPVEAKLERLLAARRELARTVFDRVRASAAAAREELAGHLASPEHAAVLNRELLAREVRPGLAELVSERRLTDAEAAEVEELLLQRYALAGQSERPFEVQPASAAVQRRLDELNERTRYKLDDTWRPIDDVMSGRVGHGDRAYVNLLDFVFLEVQNRADAALHARLVAAAAGDPALAAALAEAAPAPRTPLEAFGAERLGAPNGWSRWRVLRDAPAVRVLLGTDGFESLERALVEDMAREHLFPGGRESWPGTNVAGFMRSIGSAHAIPLLIEHAVRAGGGHTTNVVMYVARHLMETCVPEAVEAELATLPAATQGVVALWRDPHSFLNRFDGHEGNGYYSTASFFQRTACTLAVEEACRRLETDGVPQQELGTLYGCTFFHATENVALLERAARLGGEDPAAAVRAQLDELLKYYSTDDDDSVPTLVQIAAAAQLPVAALVERVLPLYEERTTRDPVRHLARLRVIARAGDLSVQQVTGRCFRAFLQTLHPTEEEFVPVVLKLAAQMGVAPEVVFDRALVEREHHFIHDAPVAMDRLTELARSMQRPIGEVVRPFEPDILASISPNVPEGAIAVLQQLATIHGRPFTALVVDSVARVSSPPRNPLVRALASPADRSIDALPLALAEKLGLDAHAQERLARLYASKTLRSSAFERTALLQHLLGFVGETPEEGRDVLMRLLSLAQGASRDPERIRRILDLVATRVTFGGPRSLESPPASEIAAAQEEYDRLVAERDASGAREDKSERKRLRNLVEGAEVRLRNLRGLSSVEERMRTSVAAAICDRLQLPEATRATLADRLEEFLGDGQLIDVAVALQTRYETAHLAPQLSLLRTVVQHVIDGDFEQWRSSHAKSAVQLSMLTPEQRTLWTSELPEVIVEPARSADEAAARAAAHASAVAVLRNLREHLAAAVPGFVVAREVAEQQETFAAAQEDLLRRGASSEEVIVAKRRASAIADAIRTILLVEGADPRTFTAEQLSAAANALSIAAKHLDATDAQVDAAQLTLIPVASTPAVVRARESDDPLVLLRIGTEPQETCQSWRSGSFNDCLLATVADTCTKAVNVLDANGVVLARVLLRVTTDRAGVPLLVLDRTYTLQATPEVVRAEARILIEKARALNLRLLLVQPVAGLGDALQEEAAVAGFGAPRSESLTVRVPPSMNPRVYSDVLGVGTPDRWAAVSATVFDPQPDASRPTRPTPRAATPSRHARLQQPAATT